MEKEVELISMTRFLESFSQIKVFLANQVNWAAVRTPNFTSDFFHFSSYPVKEEKEISYSQLMEVFSYFWEKCERQTAKVQFLPQRLGSLKT